MATTVNTAGKNRALVSLSASCTYAAALDATGELSGGTPAYARKKLYFSAPASGVLALGATTVVFDIPAGKRVTRIAYYAASVGSNQMCIDDVTPETYTAQGTYTLTSGSITLSDPA